MKNKPIKNDSQIKVMFTRHSPPALHNSDNGHSSSIVSLRKMSAV